MPKEPARLETATVLAYSAPALGLGFMGLLFFIYLMKFATDVLLIPPAAIGLIFGLSRVWDAISDPLAGYWSDRTRTRFGRRRPWLLAAIAPTALFYVMAWSPPASIAGGALTIWMTIAIFGYFTSYTIYSVPHQALGAELSDQYHERTRVFGYRQIGFALGSFLAPIGLYLLVQAETPRTTALWLSASVATAGGALMLLPVLRIRERTEFQGRGASSPWSAWSDVLRNPHARILLGVYFIESTGMGAMAILAPYVIEYVMNAGDFLPYFLPLYFVPTVLSIPVWMRLTRRFGKKEVWAFAMALSGLSFGGLFFMEPDTMVLMCVLAVFAGFAGGCGSMVGPSIQADVIDWDELETGERKEGTYFAAWTFVQKSANGVVVMLAGFALQAVGFEPNVEQSDAVKLAMRALLGLLPFTCFAIGILAFLRFRLNERDHTEIREKLAARREGAASPS